MPLLASRRFRGALALVGTAAGLAFLVAARAQAPAEPEQLASQLVVGLLEKNHLSHPTLDDDLAKKWARNYLETLDPQKYYFEKPDVDRFLARDTTLDDEIKLGHIGFAREVFDVFLKRHDERLVTINQLLKEQPDFTLDETIVDDPKTLDYPADAKDATERWRKRIKLDLLQLRIAKDKDKDKDKDKEKDKDKANDKEKGKDEPDADKANGKVVKEKDDPIKQLAIRYHDRNRFWHQFDTNDLLEVYLTALTTVVDPHTSYMGSKQLEDLMDTTLRLSLEGIGASLSSEDGYAVVKDIVQGGAADKDGRLQPEDRIVGIEKEDGTVDDLVEKKLSDVVRKIRGPKGTHVKLVVQPADTKDRKTYDLTRQKIELKDSHAKGQVIDVKGDGDKALKVGVIDLSSFYGNSEAIRRGDADAVSATQDCKRILADFKAQGVDLALIDLRRNGGGLLPEAITLSGLFIDHGPVVQVREANNTRQLEDEDEGTAWDGPMGVLISHQSASASEIFAGVIKDYKRGLIIGDSSTFGKGTVQSIVILNEQLGRRGARLPNLGALKLTIQQFYRANGESTQIKGVPPDVHIPSLLDQLDLSEGKMEHALKFDKIAEQPHDDYKRVPADLVGQLNTRSWDRRKASPKFQKQEESLKKFADRKARHAISLNEQKFRAEIVDEEDDLDEAKPKPKNSRRRHADHPVWEANYYNDEVMAILRDYLTLGNKALAAAPVRVAQ